jgi:hypothetical protein
VSSVQNGGVSRIRPGRPAELIARNIPSAASMCYDAGANQLVVPMNARFTRVAPDMIVQEITVTDPTTWTKSWTGEVRLRQTPDPLFEFACHEGRSLGGMLAGARMEEKEKAAEDPQRRV